MDVPSFQEPHQLPVALRSNTKRNNTSWVLVLELKLRLAENNKKTECRIVFMEFSKVLL